MCIICDNKNIYDFSSEPNNHIIDCSHCHYIKKFPSIDKNLDKQISKISCYGCSLLVSIGTIYYSGLQIFDCSYCLKLTDIPMISGLRELKCSDCRIITHIPPIPGLQKLNCSSCPNLTDIATIPGLQDINCFNCPSLREIPIINELKNLECSHCVSITHIPRLDNLKKLTCSHCYLVKSIPMINGLKELRCSNCPLLTTIPLLQSLEELKCYECKSLTNIQKIDGLLYFDCHRCPLLISVPIPKNKYSWEVCYSGCKWLNIENREFEEQIILLERIQKWFKRISLRKRLVGMIPQILQLYYHPEAKGGYFHKKNMMTFINNCKNRIY